jgi:hypothetical protein
MTVEGLEIFVVVTDGIQKYYLMKIVRRDSDVYCFHPNLGVHFSLHKTGTSHFRYESKPKKNIPQPAVVLVMGEAGIFMGKDVIRASVDEIGVASGICTAIYSVTSIKQDLKKFNRNVDKCFMIDMRLFPKDISIIQVGIWAVPSRNKISFEFNNPGVRDDLLYKVECCEPQIWIYASGL